MKLSHIQIIGIFALSFFVGNSAKAQLIDHPTASLTLAFEGTTGTNGSAVAYNPLLKLYYAVIAGNTEYPLEVFDAKGENIYADECGNDVRGIWWNAKTKQLEGNGYSSNGIFGFSMSDKGEPSEGNFTIFEGADHQANENSVGAYDGKKLIYYLDYIEGFEIKTYSRKNGNYVSSTYIELDSDEAEQLNYTSVIYTGIKTMELGVLNYVTGEVLLINKKTGDVTKRITLPSDAVTNDAFRFSYANNMIFLYDTVTRTWTGYAIQ